MENVVADESDWRDYHLNKFWVQAFNLNTYIYITWKYISVHTQQHFLSNPESEQKIILSKIVEKIRFQLSIGGNVNLNNLLAISRFLFVIYYIIMRCYSILFKKLFCALSEKSSGKVAIMIKNRKFPLCQYAGCQKLRVANLIFFITVKQLEEKKT